MQSRIVQSQVEEFLKEVRSCRFCSTDSVNGSGTPFVYSSSNPTILVVSEMPARSAWMANIGRLWQEHDLFVGRTRGAPHKLCEWLGIQQNEAKGIFFWIQRANCAIALGKRFAFQHCSGKFLDRALDLVKPKLVIILGRLAAEYFFQFRKITEVMGRIETYRGYDCIVLYHPSPAGRRWQQTRDQKKSITLVNKSISDLRSRSSP